MVESQPSKLTQLFEIVRTLESFFVQEGVIRDPPQFFGGDR